MPVLELHVTVVDPAFDDRLPMWGASSGWIDPAYSWVGQLRIAGVSVSATPVPTSDVDRGIVVLPDPERYPEVVDRVQRDRRPLLTGGPPAGGAAAAVRDAAGGIARVRTDDVIVLRIDDPGAAGRVHLRSWAHDEVDEPMWSEVWDHISRFGRASVFCSPGWVHSDGRIEPSRDVNPSEWAGLDEGVARGIVDLECHGYTHMHPDIPAWLRSPDRFDDEAWYRELFPPNIEVEPSIAAQSKVLERWQRACGAGTALVAPGEAWGINTLEAARQQGFALFNSWRLCLLDPTPLWVDSTSSPYLDEVAPPDEGSLVIGYWHDRDIALHGPGWVRSQLERWRDVGLRRAWAFSDLARVVAAPIEAVLEDGVVRVVRAPSVPIVVEGREPR